MLKSMANNRYNSSFSSLHRQNWIAAGIGAVLLNSILFLLLPALMHQSSNTAVVTDLVDSIQVIRLKKAEPPPTKKSVPPPKPPNEQPKPKQVTASPNPISTPKLTLPFKLDNRLPAISTDFQMPFVDSVDFGPGVTGSVDMHQLDKPLTPVARIPPVYPPHARRRGIEGWVRVGFEVDEQGGVNQVQVLEAKPPGIFEKSVMQCVSRWRFNPGTIEGIPVRAKMETTVRFEME